MSFSLSRFAKSNKKVIYFWTLNPNDLKPYKIKALNYGKETINIDGVIFNNIRGFSYAGNNYYWSRGVGVIYRRVITNSDTTVWKLTSYHLN
jgi:hypothetical protein